MDRGKEQALSRSRDSGEIAAPQQPTQRGAALPLTRMHPLFRAPVCGSQPPRRPMPLACLPPASHLPAALSDAWPCWAVGWGWGGCPSAARLRHARDTRPAREVPLKKKGSWLMPWLRHSASRRRAHSYPPPRPRARAGGRGAGRGGRARAPARAPSAVAGSAACRASCALCAELGLFIETCGSMYRGV